MLGARWYPTGEKYWVIHPSFDFSPFQAELLKFREYSPPGEFIRCFWFRKDSGEEVGVIHAFQPYGEYFLDNYVFPASPRETRFGYPLPDRITKYTLYDARRHWDCSGGMTAKQAKVVARIQKREWSRLHEELKIHYTPESVAGYRSKVSEAYGDAEFPL